MVKKATTRYFPSGPVVETPGFHCRGHRFDPKGKKKKKKINNQTKLYLGRMNNIILGHEQEYFPLSATWEKLT